MLERERESYSKEIEDKCVERKMAVDDKEEAE